MANLNWKNRIFGQKLPPPRVRKAVADILGDIGETVLQKEMAETLLPTTRFNLDYKTA